MIIAIFCPTKQLKNHKTANPYKKIVIVYGISQACVLNEEIINKDPIADNTIPYQFHLYQIAYTVNIVTPYEINAVD